VGGYEDWLRQGKPPETTTPPASTKPAPTAPEVRPNSAKKLSYMERREFDALPAKIDALETEHRALGETIADPAFYKQPAATITAALERSAAIERELAELYARWDTLDSRA